MKSNREIVGSEFGTVTNEFLDSIGIVADAEGLPKRDNFVVSRQDCIIVTADDSLTRYQEYELAKKHASDPLYREQQQDFDTNAKQIMNEEKRTLGKEAKDAERERRNALSKDERMAEDKAKAAIQRSQAKKKEQEKEEKLHKAKQTLTPEEIETIRESVRQNYMIKAAAKQQQNTLQAHEAMEDDNDEND
jgi:hypothetical protein